MRTTICLFLIGSLVWSCEQSGSAEGESTTHHDHLIHLASPVRLQADRTILHLSDYFTTPELVDQAELNGMELSIDSICQCIEITEQPSSIIAMLSLRHDGTRHDIPVFKSEKLQYTFRFAAPEGMNIKSAALAGNMNGWNPSANPLEYLDSSWQTTLFLNPGTYQYQLDLGGDEWIADPTNPARVDNGFGKFNSVFVVGNPDQRAPRVKALAYQDHGVMCTVDQDATIYAWWEDLALKPVKCTVQDTVLIPVPYFSDDMAQSSIRIWAANDAVIGNDLLIPIQHGIPVYDAAQIDRKDPHGWNMYFLMVDRFADGNERNNFPVNDPRILPIANHFGGDLSGVDQKVLEGYFEQLGMNTIWVSPITKNADGAWGLWDKGVTSKFSGYHGYWPVSSTQIDPHFGSDSSFRKLIDDVHERNMNLIVDYVANHVHENHPVYQQHPDWATDLYLPDGSMNTERWDEYRLTTWFDTFLPTLNLADPLVVDHMTDSALYWLENYPIDGFRHDATKHIPEVFWRTLTKKIKERVLSQDDRSVFQIGETYGNPELIGSYVSSGQLDAQFDFNLYDAAIDAFAKDHTDFVNLKRVFEQSLHHYGHHHLMGNITGNQDRARFISYADGAVDFSEDPKLAGWTRQIINQGAEGYEKLALLHAFNFTVPGIPCIYYGDEIGMPGANDPDNRRMMFFNDLNPDQASLRKKVSELATLRTSHMCLIYGDTYVMEANDEHFALVREYMGQRLLIVLAKSEHGSTFMLNGMSIKDGVLLSSMAGKHASDRLLFDGRGYIIAELSE